MEVKSLSTSYLCIRQIKEKMNNDHKGKFKSKVKLIMETYFVNLIFLMDNEQTHELNNKLKLEIALINYKLNDFVD